MKFVSTRGKSPAIPISEAVQRGMAPDGGLYVPETLPAFSIADFGDLDSFKDIAARCLAPFFAGDALERDLGEICGEAFSFPILLTELRKGTSVLELFHGPTAAFKDVGARFLASCFTRLGADARRDRTILVATSGDTGGAVASAFLGKPGTRIVILFPKGGVSGRQEKQLTCWGENIRAFAVRGSFDDCQKLVKAALADTELGKRLDLSSANSINIGRLLPQMAYYAASSLWYHRRHGKNPAFSIPSGNMGNSVGAFWAKRAGFPIRQIGLATNANRAVPDYFETGQWRPRASARTLANAMDVGNPSNMERVFHLYPGGLNELSRDAIAVSVSDGAIQKLIAEGEKVWKRIWCPHTATAVHLREKQRSSDWVIVATAHPAKFEAIVEPLIGRPVEVPAPLAALLARPSRFTEIEAEFETFRRELGPG